jgi:hypothetical protein
MAKQTGQNVGGKIMKDGSVTFGWFVRNRYYPLRDWRPETEKVKKIQIERDLVDKFESVSLDDFEQFTLQKHLKHLATFLSEDRVKHARSYMKSIFAEAVEQDFLLKDPTRGIKTPRNLREKDKTTLTWDQLRLVERSFAHCYETGGMRRCHLRGQENIWKRQLIHVGAFNLSLILRQLLGAGTPREWKNRFGRLVLTLYLLFMCRTNQKRFCRSRISASVAKCFVRSRTRLRRPTCSESATCTPG